MSDDSFDVWSNRREPALRFIVRQGASLPSIFGSEPMVRLGTAQVTDEIAAEVEARGYCSRKSSIRFDPARIIGEDL